MNAKLFLKNNMLWPATYNNKNKNSTDKTFFIIPKNDFNGRAWIAAINRKGGYSPKNVYFCSNHFEEACFDKSFHYRHNCFPHHASRKVNL